MINYFIKNPQARMIYGMITGIFLCYNLYGYKIYHLFLDAIITHYFISNYGRKLSAFWILIVTLIHISYIHISRMLEDFGGWNLDVSTIYMMSVVKFSAMAFSYEDGEKPDDKIESSYLREK